jgi:hypothetical protein
MTPATDLRRDITVAALFVETDGCYFGLPRIDAWDAPRDAMQYPGPFPVIAHPPCDRWHMLSAVNHKRWGFRINEDGGCFAFALAAVRQWGGVLEHPAESRAFRFHGLPRPNRNGWQRTLDGDWVTEVDQAAYGHRARKRTWLVYSGATAPAPLKWQVAHGTHQVGICDQRGMERNKPALSKAEALATPVEFRDALIGLARNSQAEELRRVSSLHAGSKGGEAFPSASSPTISQVAT